MSHDNQTFRIIYDFLEILSYDVNFSNGAILVYDITDEDSFLKVKEITNQLFIGTFLKNSLLFELLAYSLLF